MRNSTIWNIALSISLLSGLAMPVKSAAADKEKYALLVGINTYQKVNGTKEPHDLTGCLDDVHDIKDMLVSFGFPKDHIKVLEDGQATKPEILKAFQEQIVDNAAQHPDATFVFQFSGHGTDRIAPLEPGSGSHYDEAIVAQDAHTISFDELANLCSDTSNHLHKQGTLVTIIDACHSEPKIITRGEPIIFRYVSAKDVIVDKIPKLNKAGVVTRGGAEDAMMGPISGSVAITACMVDELEPEVQDNKGRRNGALTKNLVAVLKNANSRTSYRKLRESLIAEASDSGVHPQVQGDLDLTVFSGLPADVDQSYHVQLTSDQKLFDDQGYVTISGGKAMGLKAGDLMSFYSKDTKDVSGDQGHLCQGMIQTCDPFSSTVQLKDADKVKEEDIKTAKVVPVTLGFDLDPLKVVISGDDSPAGSSFMSTYREQLKSNNLFSLQTVSRSKFQWDGWNVAIVRGQSSDLYDKKTGSPLISQDVLSQFKPDDQVIYAMMPKGQPLYDLCVKADSPDAPAFIAKALSNYSKQQALISLSNADSPLNKAVDFSIERVSSTQSAKKDHPYTGIPKQLAVGQEFRIRLENKSMYPEYVYVFAIGTRGSIKQVFPPSGGNYKLDGGDFVVFPPDERKPFHEEKPFGIDSFKVFVCNNKQNFSNWELAAVRTRDTKSLGDSVGGLAQLLTNTFNRTREIGDELDSPDSWGVVTTQVKVCDKNDPDSAPTEQASTAEGK